MSEPRRCESAPKRGEFMSTSIAQSPAAGEAFALLNAATRKEFRGYGDTKTAARDRAAGKAGVSPAQAERLWKHWQTMRFPNGDVYRNLRNTYGHLCSWIENAADAMERETREIEGRNADGESASPLVAGVANSARGADAARRPVK